MNKSRSNRLILLIISILAIIAVVFGFYKIISATGAFVSLSENNTVSENTQTESEIQNEQPENPEVLPVEPEPVEPVVPEKIYRNISFAAAGDILVHTNVYSYARELAEGTESEYDFKPMFSAVKDIISSADIAYVNQETPCAGKERGYSGYPTFNTPDEIADAVIDAGFDIVNIANNHMLDKGEKGHARNIEFWSGKPVTLIGGYTSREDYENIRIIEHDGVKIALLAYTYGTNGLVLPSSSPYVIPYESYDEIDRQTKIARELADVLIVSVHWGYEDNFIPSDNQKRLAQLMANNGVDAVIGTHPHVLQPIEWIERPDGHKTLVAYSLGNFISTMMYGRNMLGGILRFNIAETDNGFVIEQPELIPTITYYQMGFKKPTILLYSEFTDEMHSKHGTRKYDSRMSKSYLDGILTQYISHDYIKDPYYNEIYGITEAVSEESAPDTVEDITA